MLAYILRWAEIYVGSKSFWRNVPIQAYHFLAWSSRKRVQRKLNCRFPDVERGTARLAPRPLFMIHGEKDSYIGPDIARGLFAAAGDPKELWIVPKAKHNRCREVAVQSIQTGSPPSSWRMCRGSRSRSRSTSRRRRPGRSRRPR